MVTSRDLEPFIGGRARVWRFMATHNHLSILLKNQSGDEWYLVLSFCSDIRLPTSWLIKAPRIEHVGEQTIELRDENVVVTCEDASLHSEYSIDPPSRGPTQ